MSGAPEKKKLSWADMAEDEDDVPSKNKGDTSRPAVPAVSIGPMMTEEQMRMFCKAAGIRAPQVVKFDKK